MTIKRSEEDFGRWPRESSVYVYGGWYGEKWSLISEMGYNRQEVVQ